MTDCMIPCVIYVAYIAADRPAVMSHSSEAGRVALTP